MSHNYIGRRLWLVVGAAAEVVVVVDGGAREVEEDVAFEEVLAALRLEPSTIPAITI